MKRKVNAGLAVLLMTVATTAQAQGLSKARSALEGFSSEVFSLVPVVAGIGGVIILLLWMNKTIRFITFVQWAGGLLLIGCVPQIVRMLTS